MCGRYASARKRQELLEEFQVRREHADRELSPDYNVAPTKQVYAVLTRDGRDQRASGGPGRAAPREQEAGEGTPVRQLRVLRWGLVPSWAKDPAIGSRLINARAETVAEKPSFRRALARRRCLLPADGYYEWQAAGPGAGSDPASAGSAAAPSAAPSAALPADALAAALPGAVLPGEPGEPAPKPRASKRGARKVPYYIHPRDGGVLAFAGLYELWRRPADGPDGAGGTGGLEGGGGDPWLWTVTIITTRAADELGRIHDRMPMVIERSRWADWLDPAVTSPDEVRDLLVPAAAGGLDVYPVSPAVNNVRNNGPGLIEPAQAEVISPGNGATGSPGPLS